jgi:hypothetical protein
LVREITLAETKLTVQRAQRRAIIERMEQPGVMPISMLLRMHPEIKRLYEQRESLVQQKEELLQDIISPGDPQITQFMPDNPLMAHMDQQIERIDERIKSIATGDGLATMQNEFRLQEEMKLFELNREIRVQEILIEELTRKYNEQLTKSAERAENVLDVSFELAQLERTHRTLDRIADRILEEVSEQRAPRQIMPLSRATSSMPSRSKCAAIAAGVGFVVFFFLPLIVCAMCCRRK